MSDVEFEDAKPVLVATLVRISLSAAGLGILCLLLDIIFTVCAFIKSQLREKSADHLFIQSII